MIRTTARLLVMPLLLLLMAASDEARGPQYTADGALVIPADYREWVFLSAGLDMSYADSPSMAGHSMFDNVFVDRASWQQFKAGGHWPEGTMLALEVRGASSRGSINKRGMFQGGERMGLEFHVRDARFPGGWAFFASDGGKPGRLLPTTADCYSCHQQHGAVDTTFVQFYPVAKAIAEQAGSYTKAE